MTFRRNSLLMIGASMAGQSALIISGMVTARALGPSLRGELAILVLFPIVVAQLADMGVPSSITYYVANDNGVSRRTIRTLLRVLTIQSAIAVAVLTVSLFATRGLMPDATPLLLASMILPGALLISQQYAYALLQGHDEFRQAAIARLAPAVSYALFTGGIWILDVASFASIAAAWSAATLVSAAISWGYVRACLNRHDRIDASHSSRDILGFGRRAYIGSIAPIEAFRLDQILGALFLSSSGVGLYVVSQALSGLPKIVAHNVGLVLFADTARAKGRSRVRKLVLLSGASFVLCGTLVLLAPALMRLLFGPEFAAGGIIAQILVVAALFSSIRRFIAEYAKGSGNPLLSTVSEITAVLSVVLLCAPLCLRWGVTGLAATIFVAQLIAFLVALVLFDRVRARSAGKRLQSPDPG